MYNPINQNKMKKYIMPTIKVKKIDTEDILAASPGQPREDFEPDASSELGEGDVASKRYGHVSCWDDDEE